MVWLFSFCWATDTEQLKTAVNTVLILMRDLIIHLVKNHYYLNVFKEFPKWLTFLRPVSCWGWCKVSQHEKPCGVCSIFFQHFLLMSTSVLHSNKCNNSLVKHTNSWTPHKGEQYIQIMLHENNHYYIFDQVYQQLNGVPFLGPFMLQTYRDFSKLFSCTLCWFTTVFTKNNKF